MGQRLVITPVLNGNPVCKIYYHWSAYSVCALQELQHLMEDWGQATLYYQVNPELYFIHKCEENGGGIDGGYGSQEWEYISNTFPNERFSTAPVNRNNGLVAISKDGMEDIQRWSEGDIYIDLYTKRISNGVITAYDSYTEYVKELKYWDYADDEIEDLEDIPESTNLCSFFLGDLDDIIEYISNGTSVYRHGNTIYRLIE